jgi:hypothetical protein
MDPSTATRTQQPRRTDRWTAERLELAALTARAFDLHTAKNYLRLSGVPSELIENFVTRFPGALRAAGAGHTEERRRPS